MQSIKTRIARGRFLLLALLLLCSVALPAAADTVLKKGSGGEAVVALQRKLRRIPASKPQGSVPKTFSL